MPDQATAQRSLYSAAPPDWAAAAVVTLTAGILYALTLNANLGSHDSAELALRAQQLGGTHATGAPLYVVIAHMATWLFVSPAAATAWLSAFAAASGAGIVALLLTMLVPGRILPIAGGLLFATLHPIWSNAVITELYALSVALSAGALLCLLRWQRCDPGGFPLAATVLLGLALGAHFANVLLLPAVTLFLWVTTRRVTVVGKFALAMLLSVLLVALANVWLASRVPPFSLYQPDSIVGLINYMLGTEHGALDPSLRSYGARLFEHSAIFLRNFLLLGLLLCLPGVLRMTRLYPGEAVLFGVVFVGYWGYFTLQGSGDYFVMVGPAYLVCCIWLVLGAAELAERLRRPGFAWLLPGLLAALLIGGQWSERRTLASQNAMATFVTYSFAVFPADALVVARWNEFTALRYGQVVQGLRPDVDLILPADTPRRYAHATVGQHIEAVAAAVCTRPVMTNRVTAAIAARYATREIAKYGWHEVLPADGEACPGNE